MRVADLFCINEPAYCEEAILALGQSPWGAILFGLSLKVSVCEVNSKEVPLDMLTPCLRLDILSLLANEESKFYLMMHLVSPAQVQGIT